MNVLKMDNQGRGITYHNGKIVFVNNALPKEKIEIDIIINKKRYSVANVSKYLEVSDDRIKPKCRYYNICGGCQLQHLSYHKQIDYKNEKIKNIFKKINVTDINNIIFDQNFNYRNKITLQVNNEIGLYKLNSNDIVCINECVICDNLINKKIKFLNLLEKKRIKQIIIKVYNNEVLLAIKGKDDIKIDAILSYFDHIYLNNKVIKGNKLIATIGNIKYYVSPNSFFQINPYITKKMYKFIRYLCQKYDSKNVLDLYCGCGSISLFIASVVHSVYGIEINEDSINDANLNKEINNINNVSFKCCDTNDLIFKNNYDTIIIDPPRSGLSKIVISNIVKSNAKNIIYVSCDPMTLIRDLEIIKSKFNIKLVQPFDMFPNTYHVETVVLLQRKKRIY